MSNLHPTLEKIELARTSGYRLMLFGVWTPPQVAIRRAMGRARETRRFPPPKHLEASAAGFSRHFPDYFEYFDRVELYSNESETNNQEPTLIAKKVNSELESYDEAVDHFLSLGKTQNTITTQNNENHTQGGAA
jgi:hypothetical protein